MMVMTGAAPANASPIQHAAFARLGTYLGQSLLGSFGGDATAPIASPSPPAKRFPNRPRDYGVEYKLAERWKLVGNTTSSTTTTSG